MTRAAKAPDNPLRRLITGKRPGDGAFPVSTSPQTEDAESKKPLQFSLRSLLGVLTGAAVFCAVAKTAGEPFWAITALILMASSYLAANFAALCLFGLFAIGILPDDPEEKRRNLRHISRILAWSLAWCFVPWLLFGVAAMLSSA